MIRAARDSHPRAAAVLPRYAPTVTHLCIVPDHQAVDTSRAAESGDAAGSTLTAAVVLRPNGPGASFRLTGTRSGRVVASVTVKFAS
jgi:hypothetical protein